MKWELTNFDVGNMVIWRLSDLPLSALGCLDKKSAAVLHLPGMSWMLNQ